MTPIKATIFILGSGGFAKEIRDYLRDLLMNTPKMGLRCDSEILFVNNDDPDALSVEAYNEKITTLNEKYYSIMGSGHCHIRKKMTSEIIEPLLSFIHPAAFNLGKIGSGTFVAPAAVIAPRVIIGKHCLINYGATVGHDTTIGDYSVIAPQAALGGGCMLGEGVYVGANASVRENIKVGDGATIGMGAIITKDVPPGVTMININERLK
jgi:sugar O-acyltransferase (sialic acid O-acetyltransferase NeuD family)